MKQYPHTIEIKNNDTVLQYPCRLEYTGGSQIKFFSSLGREVVIKAIVYIPLPVVQLKEIWSVKVFNNTYTGGVVAGIPVNAFGFRPSQQVKTGETVMTGGGMFAPGESTAIISDWAGWNIKLERIGQGTLRKGIDYTWDIDTGALTLLEEGGAVFQANEWFDITFEPKLNGETITEPQIVEDISSIVLYNGTIYQFSRGQLNARIWV